MILIVCIQLAVVITLIVASRRRFQDAIPYFCFIVTLMPLESKLVIPHLFDVSTQRVALVTLLALFLVRGQGLRLNRIPLKYLIFLHIFWAAISTLYSLSVATSFKQLISQLIEYYLLYYILLRSVSDIKVAYRTVYAMVMAMAVCSVFGVLEAYAHYSVVSIFPKELWVDYGTPDHLYVDPGRGLRLSATFAHPILFGDALAMTIPLAMFLCTVWKKTSQKVLLYLSTPVMMWALYRTTSRGPWLALCISCALMFVMMQPKTRKYLAILAVVGVSAVLSRPGVVKSMSNLLNATLDPTSIEGSSYEYRGALRRAIRAKVATDAGRALLGFGLGTFREVGLDIYFEDHVHHYKTCDDNWSMFLFETGYIGLLLMIALLMTPLVLSMRNYFRLPRPQRYFSGLLAIVLAGFYFLMYSVAGYTWGQQGYMAWILISLSVIYPRLVRRDLQKKAKAAGEKAAPEPEPRPEPKTAPAPAALTPSRIFSTGRLLPAVS